MMATAMEDNLSDFNLQEGYGKDDIFFSRGTDEFTVTDDTQSMRKAFSNLFKTSKLSDFKITVQNQCFSVHRVILSSGSHFFSQYFDNTEMTEESKHKLSLDYDPKLLKFCLEYMYVGTINVPRDEAKKLAEVAQALGMAVLHDQCLRAAYENIPIAASNCLEIWAVGFRLHDNIMSESAKLVALETFWEMPQDKSFTNLPLECVIELLSHEEIVSRNAGEQLVAAMVWVKADPEGRSRHLSNILVALPLRTMGYWFLNQALIDPLVQNNNDAKSILIEAATWAKNASDVQSEEVPCLVYMGSRDHVKGRWEDASDVVNCLPLSLDTPCRTLSTIPLSIPRNGFIACCASGGKLYVSGLGAGNNEVCLYDTDSDAWRPCGKLQRGRLRHCMAVCGGRIFVLGGSESGNYKKMMQEVEMLMPGTTTWGVVGTLPGSYCYNTCCCVYNDDIIVYGAQDDEDILLLQVFSTQSLSVSHSITLPYGGWYYVNGVAISGDHVIMCDVNNTCVCKLRDLYKDESDGVRHLSECKIPNEDCIMVLGDDVKTVVLVGGKPKSGSKSEFFVYTAAVEAEGSNTEWKPIQHDLNISRCFLRAGACAVVSLPADKFVDKQ